MKITAEKFGELDGKVVELYTLENGNGVTIKATTYGGTITSLQVPDKDGNIDDVVCGFDTLEGYFSSDYQQNSPYFGGIVGRYAARIKDAQFELNGRSYQLAANDGENHLHGGVLGFDKRIWQATTSQSEQHVGLHLSLLSEDGDQGYPGQLQVEVDYILVADNALVINYRAECDQDSPVSLTNHSYFNLSGFKTDIMEHKLTLHSDSYLKPDASNVPVGEVAEVTAAEDFREGKMIAEAFVDLPKGFEHYYLFKPDNDLHHVASVYEPVSGRRMKVATTEPGGLFYTGYYTSDELKRESGAQFGQFRAMCFETSKYPNGCNIANAPRAILKAGEAYKEQTIFSFNW